MPVINTGDALAGRFLVDRGCNKQPVVWFEVDRLCLQILHPGSDRSAKNVRSTEDILDFLADPVKESMEQHKKNLE